MNRFFKITLLTFIILFSITSCSRKKDTFINRNFHAVNTEFNTLFNGNNALEAGKNALIDSYYDDYWKLLPVERMEVSEDVFLPGESKNENFERAEEKAIKAVQKHGMNIGGKEKNPQIDEAYLLLGKARYFDQRFVPAMEALNYILYKYPASDKINQAKVWREKSNMRLDNNELAIKNLKRLLDQEEIEDQDLADVTSTLAQAYINIEALDSALVQIKIASTVTKNNDEKGRYNFIEGQLYNALGYKDSANIAFQEVIELNRKIPRIYHVNAHMERAKNFDYNSGDKIAFLEHLTEMEENRENRPYLDKVYHQIGQFYLQEDIDTIASEYYNKSLKASKQDKFLTAKNYNTLAEINFDNAKYKQAGAYYDSTMLNQKKNSKPFRLVKRKRDNLDDVIYYEDIAVSSDSILRLVNLSEEERLAYFTKYTDDLRTQAEEEQERQEALEAQKNSGIVTVNERFGASKAGGPPSLTKGSNTNNTSNFYFYNQTTVSYGKNQFAKIWGDRPLEDGWRLSNKSVTKVDLGKVDSTSVAIEDDERFKPSFYIDKIPTEAVAIDSISKERNYAYYQLGLIYKEKFSEYTLSKEKLENLLKSKPEERLIVPSKYNLFKLYELLGEPNKAEIMKNDIITNHADSRYASILLNPESVNADKNSPEAIYAKLYKRFEAQEFDEVITECEDYIREFDGDDIVPKLEFLKASASGRLLGFEAYKKAINYIALSYPNSEEGKRAQEMMKSVIPLLAKNDFKSNDTSKSFKVLYEFTNATDEEITKFLEPLTKATQTIKIFDLSTSVDMYDASTKFVVIHGLKSLDGAKGFAQILSDEGKLNITKPHIAISTDNYKIVQIHKNLLNYIESQ